MKITATKQRVIWINVTLHSKGKRAELEMLKLWREFLQWCLDQRIERAARGSDGPLGFCHGYTPHNARKVSAWLNAHGVTVETAPARR